MKNKNLILINQIPEVRFAHIYGAESYCVHFMTEVPPNQSIEISYISKGEGRLMLNDGTKIELPTNSLLCFLHKEPVCFETHSYHEHHTVCFSVPFQLLPTDFDDNDDEIFEKICLPTAIPSLPEKNRIFALIDQIIMYNTVQKSDRFGCSALVLQLLSMIDQYVREEQNKSTYMNRKYAKKAKEYIFEHLKEPISQASIAEHLGITPEYLCNIFKKTEGVSVINFVNRVKLEQIKVLMKNNSMTLSAASEIYGYSDPSYVSRLYKKYFRCTITDDIRRQSE